MYNCIQGRPSDTIVMPQCMSIPVGERVLIRRVEIAISQVDLVNGILMQFNDNFTMGIHGRYV